MSDDFDWKDPECGIIVAPRPGLAVYTNNFGAIIIRQTYESGDPDDDYFVSVFPEDVEALIRALRKEKRSVDANHGRGDGS
jgi:hypothetical protein